MLDLDGIRARAEGATHGDAWYIDPETVIELVDTVKGDEVVEEEEGGLSAWHVVMAGVLVAVVLGFLVIYGAFYGSKNHDEMAITGDFYSYEVQNAKDNPLYPSNMDGKPLYVGGNGYTDLKGKTAERGSVSWVVLVPSDQKPNPDGSYNGKELKYTDGATVRGDVKIINGKLQSMKVDTTKLPKDTNIRHILVVNKVSIDGKTFAVQDHLHVTR